MPAYMYIHPFLGLLAIFMMLAAFVMKCGKRNFKMLHYVTGISSLVTAIVATVIARWAVLRFTSEVDNAFKILPYVTIEFHIIFAVFILISLLLQVGTGTFMKLFKGIVLKSFRLHKNNSYFIAWLSFFVFWLGATILTLSLTHS